MLLKADGPLRVLVTRPEPGAGTTARRLRAAGFEPVVLPLTETKPLPAALPGMRFDAAAVTSAHALRLAEPAWLEALRGKPLFAVGARTGAAARRAGFADVAEADGDAASLARLVLSRPGVKTLLYLCGRVRRPDFEDALGAGGVSVLPAETYDTVETALPPEAISAAFGGKAVGAVLLTSALGARTYGNLLDHALAGPFVRSAVPLALSPRILLALPPGRGGLSAREPNEAALFALLAGLEAGAAPFQPSRV